MKQSNVKLSEIQEKNLAIMIDAAKMIKEKYPNETMKIIKNSIIPFTSSKQLCDDKSLGGSMAHYHTEKPHRICIKQKFLEDTKTYTCEYLNDHNGRTQGTGKYVTGVFALLDLMSHELAHHRTKAHGSKFALKYIKYRQFIFGLVISGDYYN